jgi:hypothetical protein
MLARRDNGPRIFSTHVATSGPDGRFVFERVIPGSGHISRHWTPMIDEGAREVGSWSLFTASFPAGQTVHFDFGGTGRTVTGKLLPAAGFSGAFRWNFARVLAAAVSQKERADGRAVTATVDRDGRFRMDDVPSGEYMLRVWLIEGDDFGHLDSHRFSVPPTNEGDAEPVDLGMLSLQKP